MIFKTHLLFALFVSLLAIKFFNVDYLFAILVLVGGLLPDIDYAKSYIGRRTKGVSHIIQFLFGHRGIFHSLYPVLGLALLFFIFKKTEFLALAVGYFSHLLADGFTREGVNFLTDPFRLRMQGFIKTGGFLEKGIFFWVINSQCLSDL